MKTMIRVVAIFIALFSASYSFAQQDKSKRPSPPEAFHLSTSDGIQVHIDYSKPSLKGRTVGVDLAKFGEVWRTGANEITTIEFDKDVLIEGKALAKGKYGLWTIPTAEKTTLIFSQKWDGWGVGYSDAQDVLRVETKNEKNNTAVEQFTISGDKSGKINLSWGNLIIPIHVKAAGE